MLRILHLGTIAGVPRIISDEQNRQGNISKVAWINKNQDIFPSDIVISKKNIWIPNSYYRLKFLLNNQNKFDVFHFHVNSAIVNGVDLGLWKVLQKKFVLHYHGSEIRNKKESIFYKYLPDIKFVSTPDLLKFAKNSVWIPNPSPIQPEIVENKDSEGTIQIIHAPSDRKIKGTSIIVKAIREIQKQGYKVVLNIIENKPNQFVHDAIKKSDLVIDWINPLYGIYGMVSIEAMSYGKPVMCTINPDHYPNFDEIPIINTKPENLAKDIIYLIDSKNIRSEISKKSVNYIKKYHDVVKITKQIEKKYDLL